jgi:hypothetical protein
MEISTLFGCGFLLTLVATYLVLHHLSALHITLGTLGAILVRVPDEWFKKVFMALADVGPKVFSRLRPTPSQEKPMSIVTDLEAVALTAVKGAVSSLPAPYGAAVQAVISAAENPSAVNILTAVSDIVAAIEVAEQSGVTKAIASGTVAPVSVATAS